MSLGLRKDAPTGVSGVMLGQLGLDALPRLLFPGDIRAVLSEDELSDLINRDHYLTVRHFTVAEESETFNIYIFPCSLTPPPPTRHASILRIFKELGLLDSLSQDPPGPFF